MGDEALIGDEALNGDEALIGDERVIGEDGNFWVAAPRRWGDVFRYDPDADGLPAFTCSVGDVGIFLVCASGEVGLTGDLLPAAEAVFRSDDDKNDDGDDVVGDVALEDFANDEGTLLASVVGLPVEGACVVGFTSTFR